MKLGIDYGTTTTLISYTTGECLGIGELVPGNGNSVFAYFVCDASKIGEETMGTSLQNSGYDFDPLNPLS